MKPLWMLRTLLRKTAASTSPTQFLLMATPLMMLVLVILGITFLVGRQLYNQQQVIVGRAAHAAVRHTAQLQREHLRLLNIIVSTGGTLDLAQFQFQQGLVESRIAVLRNTLSAINPPQEAIDLYEQYVKEWQALQPQLVAWAAEPGDLARKALIVSALENAELHVNNISTLVQLSFEDSMIAWGNKSHVLNRLLILGSLCFVSIILVIGYTSYLFLQSQIANEQVLRKSEQRLHAIVAAIPDAVYRINRAGYYTDYKPPVSEVECFPRDAFVGRSIRDLLPAEVAVTVQEGIETVLATEEQLILELPIPTAFSGAIHYFEARLLPGGMDEVQIVARDITTLKEQEETALQAQKLESLGVLAGGIAHDFNNLLTSILGQASLAAAKLARGLPVTDHVQRIILSAERAADLTRQLLAYTGKGKFQVGPLDVNQLIRETTSLMATVLPNRATLDLRLHEGLPQIQADRSQIQQVIMNLFINAVEALPQGEGTITITSCIHQPNDENDQVDGGTLSQDTYVMIQVTDTGIGMDQQTLSRIFDPFFSTKPKGHGLGLSATQGIIRTHHGTLQVQSQPDRGTTFTIFLPALAEVQRIGSEESMPLPPKVTTRQKSVLIIDDEVHVREVATDILTMEGFGVIVAASGREGVEVFRENYRSISVVLLDLKMPGLDGKEVFYELKAIDAEVKVIFTSGFSKTEVAPLTGEWKRVAFLPKPYTAESLGAQIYNMLAADS
jgi:signal transduction histidine kinase/ActR/RegA family two-component response regulator